MATARDQAFKILTEREIGELLKDAAAETPREVGGFALAKRAKSALLSVVRFCRLPGVDYGLHSGNASSLTYDECEVGTYAPYWGTWGAVKVDDNIRRRSRRWQ
jgi:hypothetical protein